MIKVIDLFVWILYIYCCLVFYSDFMKTILHLCADIGSDSWFYQQNREYKVILIGKEIGINYTACYKPLTLKR